MKKIWIYLLLICLLCTGCTLAEAAADPTMPVSDAETGTEPASTTAEPEPTDPPDAGIASVEIHAPEAVTVTPETADEPIEVSFADIDPTGAPATGRICTLALLRGDEQIGQSRVFTLKEGASLSLPLDYQFARYQPDVEETLTLRLSYGDETREQEISVKTENWPDEIYAEQSGDAKPYSIDVLRNENVVVVYGKDAAGEYTQIVHVFLCSTGRATPHGNYSLGAKADWNALFGGVYGQFAIRVVGNILFHSVPYYHMSKSSLESAEFNKLGTAASMGCIRMAVADVKWIYDHCPTGTAVHIYDVEELPVEKPEQILIDLEDPRAGWDPTDPDLENPWQEHQVIGG